MIEKKYRAIQRLKYLQKYNKEREKTKMKKVLKATAAMLLGTTVLTSSIGMTPAAQAKPVEVVEECVVNEQNLALKTTENPQSKAVVKARSAKNNKVAAYNKKAKKAYKKFLKGYFEQGKAFSYNGNKYKWSDHNSSEYSTDSDKQYIIKDINHDGKVELLIYNTGRPEYYLFTYYKNKVKCLFAPGYSHTFYECKKGKAIVRSESYGGRETSALYILKNGTLKNLGGIRVNSEYAGGGVLKNGKLIEEWEFFNGKGKSISKAKFKKILKKYTGSTNVKAFTACYMGVKKVKTQLKEIKYKNYKAS